MIFLPRQGGGRGVCITGRSALHRNPHFQPLCRVPTPQLSARNPNPETKKPKPEIRNPKPVIRKLKTDTRESRHENRNPRPKSETRNSKPSIRNPKTETRNPRPETRNPTSDTLSSQPSTLYPSLSHLLNFSPSLPLNPQPCTPNPNPIQGWSGDTVRDGSVLETLSDTRTRSAKSLCLCLSFSVSLSLSLSLFWRGMGLCGKRCPRSVLVTQNPTPSSTLSLS